MKTIKQMEQKEKEEKAVTPALLGPHMMSVY
jgi:hypothetical protein